MAQEQLLCRKYGAVKWALACLAAGPALGLAARQAGARWCFFPLLALFALVCAYCFERTCRYRLEGDVLEVYRGWLGRERLAAVIPLSRVCGCGVYLPGQLSERRAARVVRACLPLDFKPKHYLVYRLEEGGTGLLVFSPGGALRQRLLRERWMYQGAR